jgi:sec-independent protein translocase protein TatA
VPSLGFGEILIILVLALIIFGPRRLPEMGRTIARSLRDFRRATSDIRTELESDLEEPPPVTVEERARRIEERKTRSTPPPEDTAPSD